MCHLGMTKLNEHVQLPEGAVSLRINGDVRFLWFAVICLTTQTCFLLLFFFFYQPPVCMPICRRLAVGRELDLLGDSLSHSHIISLLSAIVQLSVLRAAASNREHYHYILSITRSAALNWGDNDFLSSSFILLLTPHLSSLILFLGLCFSLPLWFCFPWFLSVCFVALFSLYLPPVSLFVCFFFCLPLSVSSPFNLLWLFLPSPSPSFLCVVVRLCVWCCKFSTRVFIFISMIISVLHYQSINA